MKSDLNDLKKLTLELMENDNLSSFQKKNLDLINKIYGEKDKNTDNSLEVIPNKSDKIKENQELDASNKYEYAETVVEEEPLSLIDKENEMIKKALIRSSGKRKSAAKELGISERTLYRKIKQFNLNENDE